MAVVEKPRSGGEVRISRTFDAPRELVFAAWTERDRISQWCAPAGYTIVENRLDLRRGGVWWSLMRAPDGEQCVASGVYREIASPERLVFTYAHEAPDGSRGPETLVSVVFEEIAGRTRLSLHQATFDTIENRNGHDTGWNECLDRLVAHLATNRSVS